MEPSSPPSSVAVLANGIHAKRFERVVAHLLGHTGHPSHVPLPRVTRITTTTAAATRTTPSHIDTETDTDTIAMLGELSLEQLPPSARVGGNRPGQLSNERRALHKEYQIRSILQCLSPFLPPPPTTSTWTMVDFGGGTGHLAIPLALLFPNIRIICVDLGRHSLNLLHQKAKCCGAAAIGTGNNGGSGTGTDSPVQTHLDEMYQSHEDMDHALRQTSIPNLYTYFGPAHTFVHHSFDIAIALHLCGEATDVVLQLAGKQRTKVIIVAPCCVGKLSTSSHNPYVYQAMGSNGPTIQYPQSRRYRQCLPDATDWNALAEAADYGETNLEGNDTQTKNRHALRKTAKLLLETDRCCYLQEMYEYSTVLTQMEPASASPKNDIIVAWLPLEFIDRDISRYWRLEETSSMCMDGAASPGPTLCMTTRDWSLDEENEIRQVLQEYISHCCFDVFNGDTKTAATTTYVFPTGLGSRRRKLIHYIVTTEFPDQLRHWSVGKKNADKTVAIALKRRAEVFQ